MNDRIEEILKFWFGDSPAEEGFPAGAELWFGRSARIDRYIERKFGKLIDKAKAGQIDAWGATPRGRLALILVLDQFTRNVYRDTPQAFTGDEKALALCLDGLDDEMDKKLSTVERCFFYMPAMHSEDLDMQLTSVEVFTELLSGARSEDRALCEGFLKHAIRHRDVVERFERFPHRNAILGRSSTPEEATFLQQTDEI
jgi:uncharacterized protein (DUF924 family)